MSTSSQGRGLRLVLFVEGTTGPPLHGLWGEEIPTFFGLLPFDRVVGFSKHHLVAMSNANMELKHRTSTVSVGFDNLLARELERQAFDCAVVAWDLVPAWDSGSDAGACRWQDTLLLYGGLARSKVLPASWRQHAQRRLDELKSRKTPSQRSVVPQPSPNAVLSVCMEPEFEGLLLNELGVKSTLGLEGKLPREWPKTWKHFREPRPSETLAKAIEAARRMRPRPAVFRRIRQPLREAKHEWGRFFLSSAKGSYREDMLNHPISNRLKLLLSLPTGS